MKEETKAQQAVKWFNEAMDCAAHEIDGDVYIEASDGFTVMVSASEVSFRAELYEENQEET